MSQLSIGRLERGITDGTPRLLPALLAGLLIACGGSSPTAPTPPAPSPNPTPTPTPAADAVSIVTITPAGGTLLAPGQAVTFSATLGYTLATADSGQIVIVIQDQSDTGLQMVGQPQPSVTVQRGTTTVTLSDSVNIPSVGVSQVRVFFPLIPVGTTRTETLVRVVYPVG
jgi:hypothetical protein